MAELDRPQKVLVTGATGFVGRYIVRELLARGYTAVCLARDPNKLRQVVPEASPSQLVAIKGDLHDHDALARAAGQAQAAIHLVGIIFDRFLRRQTFQRIHVDGTRNVLAAVKTAGIRRYVHMSALGTRADAVSKYHRTKWEAEEYVRNSGLQWTIFRPSIIHGPDGEFMELMKTFVARWWIMSLKFIPTPFPVIPYFGDGEARLQPVSVKDVAHCFVASLTKEESVRCIYTLCGPHSMNWKELYRTCRELIPGAHRFKPILGQPVPVAKLLARTIMRTPILPLHLRFNVGQVEMSQEDSVCEPGVAEETFGIKMRDFRFELAQYADQIR